MKRDLTYRFNTELSPEDESLYQAWKKANRHGFSDEYDYDMRGAWLAGNRGDSNMHFPDEFKKPNHPTFSTQSRYYGMDGVWSTNPLNEHEPSFGGHWYNNMFFPTETNMENIKNIGVFPKKGDRFIYGIDDTAVILNPYYRDSEH